jgi:hypothetical protein
MPTHHTRRPAQIPQTATNAPSAQRRVCMSAEYVTHCKIITNIHQFAAECATCITRAFALPQHLAFIPPPPQISS